MDISEDLDLVKQNYEVAFHINPTLEEAKAVEVKSALEEIITANGGSIAFSKIPEQTRLSYAILHQRTSFFGYIHFGLSDKEGLIKLEEYLKLNKDVMRYILLKLETDEERKKALVKAAQHKERMERRAKRVQQQQTVEPKDTVQMEKQLEDIIGNL